MAEGAKKDEVPKDHTVLEDKWQAFLVKIQRPPEKVLAWKEDNLAVELKKQGFDGLDAEDIIDYWRSKQAVRNGSQQKEAKQLPAQVSAKLAQFRDITKQLLSDVWSIPQPEIMKKSLEPVNSRLQKEPSFYLIDLPASVCKQYSEVDLCLPENNPLLAPGTDAHTIKEDIMMVAKNNKATNRSDVVALVGVSGAAKTSATFLFAKEQVCIFSEVSDRSKGRSVYGDGLEMLLAEISTHAQLPEPQREKNVRSSIRKDLVVRALAYLCYSLNKDYSAYDWLQVQIDGIAPYIESIYSQLSSCQFNVPTTRTIIQDVNTFLGYNLSWILDECHLLMDTFYGEYSQYKWSLAQLVSSEICHYPVTLVAVGTILGLSEGLALATAVGKHEDPMVVYLISSFPYIPAAYASVPIAARDDPKEKRAAKKPAGNDSGRESCKKKLPAEKPAARKASAKNKTDSGDDSTVVSESATVTPVPADMSAPVASSPMPAPSPYLPVPLRLELPSRPAISNSLPLSHQLSQCLDLSCVDEALLNLIDYTLQGRARNGAGFLIHFISNRDKKWQIALFKGDKTAELEFAFLDYYDSVLLETLKANMKRIIEHPVGKRDLTYDPFDDLVRLMRLGMEVLPTEPTTESIPILGHGICPLQGVRPPMPVARHKVPKFSARPIEPIIFPAAQRYFASIKKSVCEIYTKQVLAMSHGAVGIEFDYIVMLRLVELKGNPVCDFLLQLEPDAQLRKAFVFPSWVVPGALFDTQHIVNKNVHTDLFLRRLASQYFKDQRTAELKSVPTGSVPRGSEASTEDGDSGDDVDVVGDAPDNQDCRVDARLSQVRKRFMGNITWSQVGVLPVKDSGADGIVTVESPGTGEHMVLTFVCSAWLSQDILKPMKANCQIFKGDLRNQYMKTTSNTKKGSNATKKGDKAKKNKEIKLPTDFEVVEGPGKRKVEDGTQNGTKRQKILISDRFQPYPADHEFGKRRGSVLAMVPRVVGEHQIIIAFELPARHKPESILRVHDGNVVVTIDSRNLQRFFGKDLADAMLCKRPK